MRKGSSVGLIVVLLAMAVVTILAMRSWLAIAPQSVPILNPAAADSAGVDRDGTAAAGTETGAPARKRELPGLREMRQETDKHTRDVNDAAKQSAE